MLRDLRELAVGLLLFAALGGAIGVTGCAVAFIITEPVQASVVVGAVAGVFAVLHFVAASLHSRGGTNRWSPAARLHG